MAAAKPVEYESLQIALDKIPTAKDHHAEQRRTLPASSDQSSINQFLPAKTEPQKLPQMSQTAPESPTDRPPVTSQATQTVESIVVSDEDHMEVDDAVDQSSNDASDMEGRVT